MSFYEYLVEGLESMCETRWLKIISRETDKYNKMNHKLRRQAVVVRTLIARYNELYPDKKIGIKESMEEDK